MKYVASGCLFLYFFVLMASSALAATATCSSDAWYRVQLSAGIDQPVTKEETAAFIDSVFIERFPDGMTITESKDQWRCKKSGLRKERTTVVDIQCPDTEANFTKIREIACIYIKQFVRAKATCMVKRIPDVNTFLYVQ